MDISPDVSVVVCAHTMDRLTLLTAALQSIQAQKPAAAEIILVADHNRALADAIRSEFEGTVPPVTVIENAGGKGLSGARNTGIAAASGEIVAFLDDDAVADAGWIERMVGHYADTRVIGVGGGVEPVWPAEPPRWFPREFGWVVGCSYRGLPEDVAEIRNMTGCNMSFRRAVFEVVGGFSDGLGRDGDNASGCEETELCIRARDAFPGGRILHDPAMVVHHHIAPNRTRWAYFRDRCRAEGRSKAQVVQSVGRHDGLESERRYTMQVLPGGVIRGVLDAACGDFSGLGRATAIIAGFWNVASRYALAQLRARASGRQAPAPFRPIRIVDIDLDKPLADLAGTDPATGVHYGGAFCLARSQGRPVNVKEVSFAGGNVPADRLRGLLRPGRTMPRQLPRATGEDAPFVSVVVATRGRPESLARCLDSLLAQDYPNFDIIVVDNAPPDGATAEMIARVYAPGERVRYVREDRPGLGRAHNAGMTQVTAPIAAFTDDDVIVDPGWIAAIAANFVADPKIGCVTGLILPAELETRAQVWTERHGGFGKGLVRRVFDMAENHPGGPLFPYAAGALGSGANMAFSRAALDRIGGFDNALGAGTPAKGGDDLASFSAVVKAGFRLAYEPEAIVWHHHRRAEDGMRRQAFGYGVGLGAYLTKLVIDEPRSIPHFLRALPAALRHILGSGSEKNQRLPDDYPRSLVWRERLGILAGVPCYLRSRMVNRDRPADRIGPGLVAARTDA